MRRVSHAITTIMMLLTGQGAFPVGGTACDHAMAHHQGVVGMSMPEEQFRVTGTNHYLHPVPAPSHQPKQSCAVMIPCLSPARADDPADHLRVDIVSTTPSLFDSFSPPSLTTAPANPPPRV